MKKRKNNKKILILSLLLILFLTITATQAAEIQDNTTTTSDSNAIASIEDDNQVDTQSVSENNNVLSAGEKTFTDLEDIFNQATGDRVELTDDFKYASGDNDQGIVIAKDNLTINGNGHTIDGDNQAKIFKITGNNVVLKNIIIKNTYFEKVYNIKNFDVIDDKHAAIIWSGENGTFEKVTIQNTQAILNVMYETEYYTGNIAIKGAAGLYWTGNNGTITDSTFTDNKQELIGSNSNVNFGGALKIDGINCTIKDSKFNDNYAVVAGAIRINAINTTIINCQFDNNNATNGHGGAIRTDGYYTTIKESNFNQNNAIDHYGGAIYAGNYLTIIKSIFDKNNATTGGAVFVAGINPIIKNSSFINNYAASNSGGFYGNNVNANVTLENCIFNNNTASASAAAYCYDYSKIINTNFTNNKAIDGNTGGLSVRSNCIVLNCQFINNSAVTKGSSANGKVGACLMGSNSIAMNCIFINNSAQINVAAVRFNGDNDGVYNSIFINNSCPASSGAIVNTYLNGIVSNCTFINNTANSGAAISVPSSNRDANQTHMTITDCTFINNTARNGGAIYLYTSKDIISNSIFINNNATNDAGAIYISTFVTADINSCIFINNTATTYGGAIRITNTVNNFTIKNNAFINSTNEINNGIRGSSYGIVESNWFGSNNPTYKVGSYLKAELVKINNSDYLIGGEYNPIISIVFRDSQTNETVIGVAKRLLQYNITNSAINTIFVWKDSSVSGKILGNDVAKQKFNISAKIDSQDLGMLEFNGTDYNIGNAHSFTELQRLINASAEGDVIELHNNYQRNVYGDIPTIVIDKALTIKSNVVISGSESGVIFTITADKVTLEDLTLKDGKSTGNGGAISWTGNDGKITNVKFINNNAAGNGGAIYSTGNNTQINSAEFSSNIAQDGSAVYIDSDGALLSNLVFNKNTARLATGSDVYIKGAKSNLENVSVIGSEHNAITIIGDNTTVKDIKMENITGNGLTTDGANTTINKVNMSNVGGNGINTNGVNTSISDITANIVGGAVIETNGFNTTISNVNANNTDKVISSKGDNLKVSNIVANNTHEDVVTFDGDNVDANNINGYNVNGTVLNGKGNNYKVKNIGGDNVAGGYSKLDGTGQATGLMPANPATALKIPSNPDTNSPTYKIEEMPNNANGYFNVYVDGDLKGNTTVRKGIANPITVYNLTSGTHRVKLEFIPTGSTYKEMVRENDNVTIKSPPVITLTGNNLDVDYTGLAVYKVVVLNDGKNITDGENITITFNNVKYTVKTFNGTATLTLNTAIQVKTYTITATYMDKTTSNTIIIKNIINANKLKKLKKSKKVNKVKITLLKVDGKVQVGKTIILKLKNKKVASAKTNSKGVATLKVKKKALKKFKKGKKVVATVIYGADTVTKKIKIA